MPTTKTRSTTPATFEDLLRAARSEQQTEQTAQQERMAEARIQQRLRLLGQLRDKLQDLFGLDLLPEDLTVQLGEVRLRFARDPRNTYSSEGHSLAVVGRCPVCGKETLAFPSLYGGEQAYQNALAGQYSHVKRAYLPGTQLAPAEAEARRQKQHRENALALIRQRDKTEDFRCHVGTESSRHVDQNCLAPTFEEALRLAAQVIRKAEHETGHDLLAMYNNRQPTRMVALIEEALAARRYS